MRTRENAGSSTKCTHARFLRVQTQIQARTQQREERERDRQTDRQRQRDRQTDRQPMKQTRKVVAYERAKMQHKLLGAKDAEHSTTYTSARLLRCFRKPEQHAHTQ